MRNSKKTQELKCVLGHCCIRVYYWKCSKKSKCGKEKLEVQPWREGSARLSSWPLQVRQSVSSGCLGIPDLIMLLLFAFWANAPSHLSVMLYNLRSWWRFAVCSVSICSLHWFAIYLTNSYLKMKIWLLWFPLQTIANMTTGESFSSIETEPYVQLPNNLVP